MISLTALVLLALASYRIVRFLVIDDLLNTPRARFHNLLLRKQNFLTEKLLELTNCTWCTGVWVSAAVYYLYTRAFELSVPVFLNIAAIAGAQGLLHAFEPDGEDV